MKRPSLLALAAAAAVTLPLVGLPVLHAASPSSGIESPAQALDLIGKAMAIVRSDYVEPVTDEKMTELALNGILSGLDPHSSYLNKEAYNEMRIQTRGAYGGLGMEVTEENSILKVVSPIDDTPAAKAGIRPGDIIARIDGETTAELSLSDAVAKLRGAIGSSVVVTIIRQGQDPFDVTLERAEIKIKSVKSRLEQGTIGYLRISSFIEETDRDLRTAVEQLQKEAGNRLIGYVLDLRNNPGGLVDQAVAVSDDFLEKGDIVSIRGRRADEVKRYTARPGDITKGLPVVALINGGSASASEIVAGALRDNRRAILIGTKTFGKGSVQTIIPLEARGALRLTTARYYTPSGRSIQAEGIAPDILVEAARIEKVAEARTLHEADLRNALKNPEPLKPSTRSPGQGAAGKPTSQASPPATAVATKGDIESETIGSSGDYQLSRAIDLVKGMAFMRGSSAN
jgi:carboxyl-terminal processing protease